MCCTAAQGCGVVKRNWLDEATYKGPEILGLETFNTWDLVTPSTSVVTYWALQSKRNIPYKINDSSYLTFFLTTYSE